MALTMKKWMTGVGLLWGLLLPSAAMAEPPEIPPDIQTYLDDFRTAVSEVEDARLVFSRRAVSYTHLTLPTILRV